MNSSFYFLDRGTHVKIVLLAAVLAGVVVAVGESAQLGRSGSPAALPPAMPGQAAQSLKALSAPVVRPQTKPEAKRPAIFPREAA